MKIHCEVNQQEALIHKQERQNNGFEIAGGSKVNEWKTETNQPNTEEGECACTGYGGEVRQGAPANDAEAEGGA